MKIIFFDPEGVASQSPGSALQSGVQPRVWRSFNPNPRQKIATRSNRYRRVGQGTLSEHIAQAPFSNQTLPYPSAELSVGNIPAPRVAPTSQPRGCVL
ncbi:MAG: hypothetical protein R3220_10300 [Balneolaceae bacterium]|nr:hypothetical protein [Balneolaceae bacterium]